MFEASLAANTVFLDMKLCTSGLGYFLPIFFEILSSSLILNGYCHFRSLQRYSKGFKSGLQLGPSSKFIDLTLSHICIVLAVGLGPRIIFILEMNLQPSMKSSVLWNKFYRAWLCTLLYFVSPSTMTSLPFLTAGKQLHSMMPPPCFLVGMVMGK